jgi:DNA polymerase III subunit epsilon
MTTVAVIDFETTGMRAGQDRIIEVAAAIVDDGVVVATFAELMNPGFRIPAFITSLTGISNAMVRGAPPPEAVMPRLRAFLGDRPCLAHHAAFDQRFFTAEMERAQELHPRQFLCSVLLARRLVPDAPSHRLGALATHLDLTWPSGMQAHRALADVLVTAALWRHLLRVVTARLGGHPPDLALLSTLMRQPKAKVAAFLAAAAPRAAAAC